MRSAVGISLFSLLSMRPVFDVRGVSRGLQDHSALLPAGRHSQPLRFTFDALERFHSISLLVGSQYTQSIVSFG